MVAIPTSGCVRRAKNVVNREGLDQLSITITCTPADGDREAIQIARQLAANLEAVGAVASIDIQSTEEYLRSVLVNHDFDCYVGYHPWGADPDFLYEALHSRYADESGWQNPYGYTNATIDELLDAQRRTDGEERREVLTTLLETIGEEQPFVPICRPAEYRVVRTDRFEGWDDHHLATRLGYLGLEPIDGTGRLRAVVIDPRPSKNLNPIAVEYRDRGTIVDLLYDSLATGTDSEIVPWLATDWEWDGDDDTLRVTLRDGCRFHDGEPVTTADVAFTYRFLSDTSLGRGEVPAPAPRYRGLVDAVTSITVHDERNLSIGIAAGETIGKRVLTVPILPQHVWEERSNESSIWGVRTDAGTTEALVTDNVPAIGSGPFVFESRTERDHLSLVRNEEHFTLRSAVDLPEPTVESLRFQIDPRSASAIERIESNDADATLTPLEAYAIDDVDESEAVRLVESQSWTFYHVGFNVRNAPFSNLRLRQVIGRLLDAESIVDGIFEGYAQPIATPVTDEWVPESLVWDGEHPISPFIGSDGDLHEATARNAFESAGFTYDETGRLLVRH